MALVLDHTIIDAQDVKQTVAFYVRILGAKDEGKMGPFAVVRINDSLTLDFVPAKKRSIRHVAFAMDPDEFEAAFKRIQAENIPFGDGPGNLENRRGPGMTLGARGEGKAVYFRDPNGHVLEIKTY